MFASDIYYSDEVKFQLLIKDENLKMMMVGKTGLFFFLPCCCVVGVVDFDGAGT